MTISSTVRIAGPYIGSGAATVFPFAFKVFAAAEMQVAKLNTTSNVEIILVLNTDYTVQLNGDQNGTPGGTITLPAVLASGFNLTITSDIANLQPTDLTNQGGFYPEVITDALDRATIQIQQLDQNSRAIKIPLSDGVLDMTTPVVAARQGKYLAFDSLGLPVVSSGTGSDSALRTDLANATAVSAGSRLSGFRQDGTGATARTVDAKLKDTVSVKDFGAVGDGVADDTAAIQAALNATEGLNIFIPKGVYIISSQLTAQNNCCIFGDNRDTSILKYNAATTITGGAILKFANKSAISVQNIGFRCQNSVLANNTIMLHLEDCVYFNITDLSFGATSTAGQNSLIGIKCNQTTSGFVPPRGNGVFRNILYVVEPTNSGSISSVGIWIQGHVSQAMNHVTCDGEGGIEHGYYGIKLENANNCHIANWQIRGSTFTEIALINSSNNVIIAPAIVPPPTVGIGISLDANCFDNTIISPAWNFSSGNPLSAISDNGNRTVIISQSAVGILTPKNKLNGSFEFRKPDAIGATASFIRSTTDTDNGLILQSDYNPIDKAFLTINRGSGPSGNDIARYEGGTVLFERVSSAGQRFIRTINSVPADGDLNISQCTFYLNEGSNELKVKVKYAAGTVRIGTINLI